MKTKLLLLLLFWTGVVWGQESDVKVDGNYYFKNISRDVTEKLHSESKLYKSNKDNISALLEGTSYKVSIIKIQNDRVYFVFGLFDGKDEESLINYPKDTISVEEPVYFAVGGISNKLKTKKNIQYSLPLNIFKENVSILYNRIDYRVGIYTIPFKLRLSSFSFDANVNLGANLGAKIRWDRRIENGFAIEPILGFGLASIKLDKDNSTIAEPSNVSAFTVNTGFLIHLTNTINVGLTYGFDNISQNDQHNYKWKYQGKGWVGVGLNVSFSNQSNNTGGATKN